MSPDSLLQAYTAVRERNRLADGRYPLPAMYPGNFGATTDRPTDPLKAVRDFEPVEGWLGFQSRNYAFTAGEFPATDPDEDGCLLSAECIDARGRSLHLRQDGRGGWIATTYTHSDGAGCLYDIVAQIAAAPPEPGGKSTEDASKALGRVRYRRYWGIDDEHGTVPVAACFIGFGTDAE